MKIFSFYFGEDGREKIGRGRSPYRGRSAAARGIGRRRTGLGPGTKDRGASETDVFETAIAIMEQHRPHAPNAALSLMGLPGRLPG
jgi:hypothetical protein